MRKSVAYALLVLLLWAALALPYARRGAPRAAAESLPAAAAPPAEGSAAPATAESGADTAAGTGFDAACRICVLVEGQRCSMDLRRYLTGVLLAELPERFSDACFQAQAVASRTYALRSDAHRRHDPAALCDSASCCQGWLDPDSVSPQRRARAEAAVDATDGLVIRCGGKLIEATFFSCSGGRTEDAAAVWGNDLPYLRSVESLGEEEAAHYRDETRIPLSEFRAALTELDPAVELEGDPALWIGAVVSTAGGGVEEIRLGGRPFRGTDLRKRFALRSTAFELRLEGEEAVFTTRGFGHRVGMSQYGAEAMARAGNDFETILKWYYTGVEIGPAER